MAAEKSVVVPLGADETFKMLTEPARLRRWQTVTARVDLRAGGDYRWTIVPGHTAAGKVVEVEPGRRLVMTWGWEDSVDLPPGASTVTITLEPTDGGTLVRLADEGLTDEQAASHLQGWTHYLDRLQVAARNGDAGADDWAAAPEPIDQLGAAEASLALCQLALRRLRAGDATLPTPCAKFTVTGVVDHLLGSIVTLGGAAGAAIDVPEDGEAEVRVADAAQQATEAWRRRRLEGDVEVRDHPLPASMAGSILALEILVHGWDVARATSQSFEPNDALSGYVLGLARSLIIPQRRDGDAFAAEIEVGPDASHLERLVAFTGRAA